MHYTSSMEGYKFTVADWQMVLQVLLTGRPLSCLAAAFGSGAARRSSARSPFPFVRYASLEHPRSSGSTLSACLGTTWSHQFQRYLLPPARNITLTCATAAVTQEPNEEQHESSEAQPPVEYCVVNFYHLVDIPRPRELVKQHAAFLEGRDVRGRIYISEQGVNAQYGGVREDAVAYAKWLAETQPLFQGLRYSVYDADDHMFPKLRLKYKPNLISLAGGMSTIPVTQPSARATPVEPSQWKQMLAEGINGQRPLVLDVRNSYEWDAGHFVGAKRPLEDEFNETPTEATPCEVPDYLEAAGPDTPVMMYCTGGIRCDVYSAYLKRKGYNKLYTLEGGIQNYMSQEGLEHWKGSLFVFDGRMAIRKDRDRDAPLEAAVPCQVCQGEAVLPHANCANIDCNQLFIACNTCMVRRSCCL